MAENALQLPSRLPGRAVLANLDLEDREEFQANLMEALWDAHEADSLPPSIVDLLRDWVAYARFDKSPEAHERIAEARRRTASV